MSEQITNDDGTPVKPLGSDDLLSDKERLHLRMAETIQALEHGCIPTKGIPVDIERCCICQGNKLYTGKWGAADLVNAQCPSCNGTGKTLAKFGRRVDIVG